ncbi:hypothetical protein [Streptomyces cupreus]|uniref:Uncharacterized protein n=1 Tax=Streptomyces cupreus TaxID=2759956 RepID=A0A7X1MCI3_9ACTN|nr:hypothetical protein [Streptomyces cupreus]MBC2903715.1 hypothetical protein [Streptomyces cupreus]
MTSPATTDSAPQETDVCLHFHALFLDTRLDVVWSPGLGRRIRAGLARLVTGRGDGPVPHAPDAPARFPEEKPQEKPEEKGVAR